MGGDISPRRVEDLSKQVRAQFPELKTAWYSGRDVLPEEINAESFNYIKLGRYSETLGGLRSRTTNQRMYKIQDDGTMLDITTVFYGS